MDQHLKNKLGTPYYIAPEVLEGKYNEKCDIWSIGVIMYIMLCGYPPFNGNNDKEIFDSVKHEKLTFPEKDWSWISDEAKDFIRLLCCRDIKKRLSAKRALNHSWIK